MPVVFFDVDKTLIKSTTPMMMVKYYLKKGEFGAKEIFWTAVYTVLYTLDLVDYRTMLHRGLAPFVGRRREVVRLEFVEIFEQYIRPAIYSEARSCIDKHRKEGHRVVLLTSTSIDIADPIAEHLGVELIATTAKLKDGRYIDDFIEPMPIAEGKLTAARMFCEKYGHRMEEAYFYSDSHSDLALLSAVGNPRVVNPDPRLKRKAEKLGWPILSFILCEGKDE